MHIYHQRKTNRMSKTDNMIKRAIYSILLILITSLKVMGIPYCDVRKFSITDGLAANTISGIAQTPDRLMWFSTWNGISYYDGNSFHTFRDEADDKALGVGQRAQNGAQNGGDHRDDGTCVAPR